MKIKGRKIEGSNIEICVIPRSEGDDVVFKATSILDMDDFENLCPEPKPPKKIIKGGLHVADTESPVYKALLIEHGKKRVAYMILKSLEATPDLEWETVNLSDSSTWENYEKELRASGFSNVEIMRIVQAVMRANCLDEEKLEEARKSFLASQSTLKILSFPEAEQESMLSGGLVKE